MLVAFGFTPSTADPSLFPCTDPSLLSFYIPVYVDDLFFAIADRVALALLKAELQKRPTCTGLDEQPCSSPVLHVKNKAVVALCREKRLENRRKHIALRYFLARELQQRSELQLSYVASQAKTADIFTKALWSGAAAIARCPARRALLPWPAQRCRAALPRAAPPRATLLPHVLHCCPYYPSRWRCPPHRALPCSPRVTCATHARSLRPARTRALLARVLPTCALPARMLHTRALPSRAPCLHARRLPRALPCPAARALPCPAARTPPCPAARALPCPGGTGAGGVGDTGAGGTGGAGAGGSGGTGGAGAANGTGTAPRGLFSTSSRSLPYHHLPRHFSHPPLLLGSPLPGPSSYPTQTGSLVERRKPKSRPASPVRTTSRAHRSRPPPVPSTHTMALRPSSIPQHVVLPSPPASSLPDVPDPESKLSRAASPTVTSLLATVVTDPSFESTASSSLVTELVDIAATHRLNYVASLVTESESVCPSSVPGELALNSDVLEDRQFELECLTTVLPCFTSMLLCPEGDTCTDLGELYSYLGLQITWDRARRTITLTQSHMVHQVLQRFGFQFSSPQRTPLPIGHSLSALPLDESVEPSGPYLELVGYLMDVMTCTRPDLAYRLSILARFVAPGQHRKEHWTAAQRVMHYLCSALSMGLVLGGRGSVVLTGHSGASRADDQATHWSSQGYSFSLGSGSVSWRSTRSSSVIGSSC
ncbi:unnamed protein product [Closterium sp. NIES-54]